MSATGPEELPRDIAGLLDSASSEAKRRGHAEVTPAHIAVVLRSLAPNVAAAELDEQTTSRVDTYLVSLPRTYATPEVSIQSMDLVNQCVGRADALAAIAVAIRSWAGGLETPADEATAPLSATGTDAPEREGSGPVPATASAEKPGVKFSLPTGLRGSADVVTTSPPVVPRADVVRRLLAMLTARDPQTPLVVASEGQGRTAIARCLAARLADPEYAGPLAGLPVLRVRPEGVIASRRAASLAAVLESAQGSAIVFVDDVEVLCALGGGGGDPMMLAALRSALHNPDLRVVFTVAAEFVDRFQAVDGELFDELNRVDLPPLADDEIVRITRHSAQELAAYHRVEIGPEVVAAAAAPPRQIDTKSHPALAVSRLDRAAAAAAIDNGKQASMSDLGSAVIGQQYLTFDPEGAGTRLKGLVLGQEHAVDAVVARLAITRAALDMRPERPDGVFLFAGPTGTGKTELALRLADEVYGTAEALIRIDMSEYASWASVNKLFGSPPGYVGSTDPESWLTTRIRRRPQSVLLLDEIEKAHPRVWNSFLQVFDAGRLTDSQGRVADFRDVIIVMTTNIGAAAFDERNAVGFAGGETPDVRNEVMTEIRNTMQPELINRIDEILVFRPLGIETVRSIVTAQLERAVHRLQERGWRISYDSDVIDLLCRNGYSRRYGARPLTRALESDVLGKVWRHPPGDLRILVEEGHTVVQRQSAPVA